MEKIAIFGVPRSGTSWLGQIINSHPYVAFRYQPLFSYTHKGQLNENSSHQQINAFFDDILLTDDPFALMKSDYHKNHPRFLKEAQPTHIAFKETRYLHIIENLLVNCPDVKVIGIIRNPLSTLTSWVQAPRDFQSDWDIIKEWRWAPKKNAGKVEDFFGYEKWKQAAADFLRFSRDFPQQFRLVQYERLVNDPLTETRQLFQFCGLSMDAQTTRFITDSRKRHDDDAYSVFRSQTNGQRWMEVLPEEISQAVIADLSGSTLADFLS